MLVFSHPSISTIKMTHDCCKALMGNTKTRWCSSHSVERQGWLIWMWGWWHHYQKVTDVQPRLHIRSDLRHCRDQIDGKMTVRTALRMVAACIWAWLQLIRGCDRCRKMSGTCRVTIQMANTFNGMTTIVLLLRETQKNECVVVWLQDGKLMKRALETDKRENGVMQCAYQCKIWWAAKVLSMSVWLSWWGSVIGYLF